MHLAHLKSTSLIQIGAMQMHLLRRTDMPYKSIAFYVIPVYQHSVMQLTCVPAYLLHAW